MKPWNMQNVLRKNRVVWSHQKQGWSGGQVIAAKLVHQKHQSSYFSALQSNDWWAVSFAGPRGTGWWLQVKHGWMKDLLSYDLVRVL